MKLNPKASPSKGKHPTGGWALWVPHAGRV